jgi:hypothetical protein
VTGKVQQNGPIRFAESIASHFFGDTDDPDHLVLAQYGYEQESIFFVMIESIGK